ncbi:MAG: dienelactone hydrolase family protein [Methanomicrobiaceae archaeon]|nr:dienelactone hydrolase family protein [Methanomicrobiaceae archaeon]
MRKLILVMVVASLIVLAGCTDSGGAGGDGGQKGTTVDISSGGRNYPAYTASPDGEGKYPGVVLIHSFNGLEPGYRDMADLFAAEGFVVIVPAWQTYDQSPEDGVVELLIRDTIAHVKTRGDVDPGRLGLTGFCAGGRYTMLFLPQIEEFKSGVAWYGFPYSGGFNNETTPAEHIGDLVDPMLIIHGSRDQPSPVANIYHFITELDEADKYFELKVYQGEPHGFMIENGTLSQSFVAQDAYGEMVDFFTRTLI